MIFPQWILASSNNFADEGNYNNVVSAVDQYSKYDYNANSDYDEDAGIHISSIIDYVFGCIFL